MKVINLYGGPGTGKSTGAAHIFSKLKLAGYNTELITEYAKRKIYEKSDAVLENQVYLLGKQYKSLKDLQNYGVDVAVSDSPLMLGMFYGQKMPYFPEYVPLMVRLNQEFENIDIFLKRVKDYNPSGRQQTEEQSDQISNYLEAAFGYNLKVDGSAAGYDKVVEYYTTRYPKS